MSLSAVAAAASGCVKGCTCPVGNVILALASPLLAFVHKVEKEEVIWSLPVSSGIVFKLLPLHTP